MKDKCMQMCFVTSDGRHKNADGAMVQMEKQGVLKKLPARKEKRDEEKNTSKLERLRRKGKMAWKKPYNDFLYIIAIT